MNNPKPLDQNPKSWNWGIIGTGSIARTFAHDLQYVPGAIKNAVYSRTAAKGKAFGDAFSFSKTYDDFNAFLAADDIDIVYIATPHIAHEAQALAAIKAGKAVLIEKPITMTAAQARNVARASAKHNVFAMEALWTRFLPPVQRAKAILESGQLGKILRADAVLHYERAYDPQDRLFNPDLGGGVMHDLGVYPLSVASYLLGDADLIDSSWYPAPNGVNRQAEMSLSSGDVSLKISTAFGAEGENSFCIYGEKGALRIDRHFVKSYSVTTWNKPVKALRKTHDSLTNKIINKLGLHGGRKEVFPREGTGLNYQASAVQAALGQGLVQHPVMPLEQSAKVIDIIEQVLAKPPASKSNS